MISKIILVAEYDDHTRSIFKKMLSRKFSTIIEVKDISEALVAIKSQRIDIMLTGICFPGLDGFHLAKLIRGLKATEIKSSPQLPIIATDTSQHSTSDYPQISSFILLPVSMNHLIGEISRWL
jgi:CheY-like chemotaxis protein